MIYAFCQKVYMHSTPTLCVLHSLLISSLLCFLSKSLQAFDNFFMRATCPTSILTSMKSTKNLHAFETNTMRATCFTNIIEFIHYAKKVYMHLTPTRCVLHALLISYHQCLLWKNYMHLTRTLCVLHALLISYHLCFLPKTLHEFETHIMRSTCPTNITSSMFLRKMLHEFDTHFLRATCPTNILSSMISAKRFTCIWHPHYACYVPYKYPIIYAFCQKVYMFLTPTLCVLHVLLISYYLCFLPNSLNAFYTHTMRATCPTNALSSMFSGKTFTYSNKQNGLIKKQ
jgi:hypothetical protein